MVKRDKRFQVVLNESPSGGVMMATVILLDTATGVLYLQVQNGYAGGLTPLLNPDGKPIVWDIDKLEEEQ